jgi:hypothetical protein
MIKIFGMAGPFLHSFGMCGDDIMLLPVQMPSAREVNLLARAPGSGGS